MKMRHNTLNYIHLYPKWVKKNKMGVCNAAYACRAMYVFEKQRTLVLVVYIRLSEDQQKCKQHQGLVGGACFRNVLGPKPVRPFWMPIQVAGRAHDVHHIFPGASQSYPRLLYLSWLIGPLTASIANFWFRRGISGS